MAEIDLRRMAAFRALAATGSVTAAAERLHKVPSAVSYELRKLEEQLGFALTARHGRGLRLTAEGRLLAQAFERAHREVERAVDRLARPQAVAEPLRVVAVSGFGRYRLVPALLRLLPPSRPLDVRFATADDALRLVEDGIAAFGVSYRPMISRTVQSREVGRESLVLVSPLDAPKPRAADVPGLRYVTYDEFEYVFAAWLRAHRLEIPARWNVLDHCGELEEALEAVACGRGHCIVPGDAAEGRAYRGRLRVDALGRRGCANGIYLFGTPQAMESEDAALVARAAGGRAVTSPRNARREPRR